MDLTDLTKHFTVPGGSAFDVTPEAAIDYFNAKGMKPTFAWQDLIGEEHAHAFTVAKMMDVDLLAEVHASLQKALEEGVPFKRWADDLVPTLQAKGWWGRKAIIDPATGQTVVAGLGSPHRLATIFRTNLQSAYAQGQWELIEAQAEDAPYLLYDAIDDHRTRPEHRAWDGTLLPVTSKWWKTHTPPCGWNCRCSVIQLDEDDVKSLGLEVLPRAPSFGTYQWTNPRTGQTFDIPMGVDPGFGQAAAKRVDNIEKLLAEKVAALPAAIAPFAQAGVQATIEEQIKAGNLAVAKAEGAARLSQSEAKLAKLGAELEIQNAQAAKVPYLAKALKDLITSGKADDLGPIELLAKAKAQAAKAKQSAGLAEYKKALLNEKTPGKLAQEAFDNLPAEAQSSLVADLQAQLAAKKAEAAAKAKLDELLASTPSSAAGKAVAELKKAGALEGTAIEQLAKVEAKVAEVKAKANQVSLLSAYKAKILEGKVPTEAQKAAFDALPEADKEAFLVKVQKEQAKKAAAAAPAEPATPAAAPAPATATADLDGTNLTQIGPQRGSNPGGLFQDTATGEKWYVKFPSSPEIARNEALTAELYRLAGIDAPEYRLVTVNGRQGIASRFVDGLQADKTALVKGAEGVAEGFGMDAWLANWDVVGLNFDNMLLNGARVMRVDTGGGLLYRAQGGAKGGAFGDKVTEIDSLRDPRTNSQAAAVFGKLSAQQIEDGVRRVLRLSDDDIRKAVDTWGPLDAKAREQLTARLLARKADLWERYPGARPLDVKPAPVADAGQRVSAIEQQTIEAARSNGYALRTDGGDIEDHNVTVAVFKTTEGQLTRAHLKVMPAAGERIEKLIGKSAGEATLAVDTTPLAPKILELVKGINSRAAKGGALEQKNIDRWNALKPQLTKALLDLAKQRGRKGIDQKLVEAQIDAVGQWSVKLEKALTGKGAADVAQAIEGKFDHTIFAQIFEAPVVEGGGLPWKKLARWEVPVAQVEKGFGKIGTGKQVVPGVSTVYRAEVEGVTIDYVPFKGNDSGRAFQGTIHIDAKGAGVEATDRALAALEELGIKTHRSTDLDRQELYLNKVARLYTIRNSSFETVWTKADSADLNQAARIEIKLRLLNQVTGKDLTKSDQWGTYTGTYQAFGHGRALQMRPDLDDAEFNAFAKEHVLYNNPTGLSGSAGSGMWERVKLILEGGGIYSSRADMVRRGLPMASGTSVSSDIRTGGGNYIFTRIRRKGVTGAGIYWKAENLRRLDAISYPGDMFGSTEESVLRHSRKVTVDEWRGIAGNNSNETIFKDGLSLFDNVEKIVFPTKAELEQALTWFKANGYDKWPDGRKLEDVLRAKG